MPGLPVSGGGYQNTDGNNNDPLLFVQQLPVQTATATATLTAAQISGGILVANPSTTAATYTLPTVAALEAAIPNANRAGQALELSIINLGTSSGAITLAVGTGWTIVGSVTIAVTSSAYMELVKTGDGTWTLYRQS
jgi:hypothetical protein